MVCDEGSDIGVATESHPIQHYVWFADKVRAAGIVFGLKNAINMVKDSDRNFDVAVNESCPLFDEGSERNTNVFSPGFVYKICCVRDCILG